MVISFWTDAKTWFIKTIEPQRLINLEIPALVRSLKPSNVEFGYYLDGSLFKHCLSVAAKVGWI